MELISNTTLFYYFFFLFPFFEKGNFVFLKYFSDCYAHARYTWGKTDKDIASFCLKWTIPGSEQ